MKKFLGIAISTLMVGSMLIGCGGDDKATTTTEAAVETTTVASSAGSDSLEAESEPMDTDIMSEETSSADISIDIGESASSEETTVAA